MATCDKSIMIFDRWCIRPAGGDCDRCVRTCPHQALFFAKDEPPQVNADFCTGCGLCIGVCDAFEWTDYLQLDLVERVVKTAEHTDTVCLTCMECLLPDFIPAPNVVVVPCLAAMGPDFYTLLLSKGVKLTVARDKKYCINCAITAGQGGRFVDYILASAQKTTKRTIVEIEDVPERGSVIRDLANMTLLDAREAGSAAIQTKDDILSGERTKRNNTQLQEYMDKRAKTKAQGQLNHLHDKVKAELPRTFQMKRSIINARPELADVVRWDKVVTDESCDNSCNCVDVCPTHARSLRSGQMSYSEGLCIGCGLCIKACPNAAVHYKD